MAAITGGHARGDMASSSRLISRRTLLKWLSGVVAALAAKTRRAAATTSEIESIEIETWTSNASKSDTDDAFDCGITFADGSSFRQGLGKPKVNDRELGQRDRFALDLSTPEAAAAIAGQAPSTIRSLEIRKLDGENKWRCEAIGIRVNNLVLMSRYVNRELELPNHRFTVPMRTDGRLDGLELRLDTGDMNHADTDDRVYCNVVFLDGSLLYSAGNLRLDIGQHVNDFERSNAASRYPYLLPLPESLNRAASDVAEIYIRKGGTDGWLLQGAQLFANGQSTSVIGNGAINQFLDNSDEVLGHADWSSRSLLAPCHLPADEPLPESAQYGIAGPVLGHMGADAATILYRVEREGAYRLVVQRSDGTDTLPPIDAEIRPTATFRIAGLTPETAYAFRLFRVTGSSTEPVSGGDGSFRTAPPDGTRVSFSFGLGSCSRTGHDPVQPVWTAIAALAPDARDGPSRDKDLAFFVHGGDTFYFYDDVMDHGNPDPPNVQAMLAGHLSARKNRNFLAMARRVPCYAVWDDHDFRGNNLDGAEFALREDASRAFLSYWGNPPPAAASFGLSTRFSYGNVDFYLLDGRYCRVKNAGRLFGEEQCRWILDDILDRGPNRVRVLISGSNWNHTYTSGVKREAYGHSSYEEEREGLYAGLADLVARGLVAGLVFASGDVHSNHLYEIALPQGGRIVAPEIVCSPLTDNRLNDGEEVGGERKWCRREKTYGFARIQIDTVNEPWTMTVSFVEHNGSAYHTKTYRLQDGQFRF